jgi:AraC family transcriptional regulator of adaptative response / DNA-3-methyladenine glycosylase II
VPNVEQASACSVTVSFNVRKRPVGSGATTYPENVQLDDDLCFRATRSRDPRFDGRFFTAVITTGIYCRPICPAKEARREHLRFFAYAAAAERAGFRPCLRCRPEVAPWTPAWNGTSATVTRALRLIGEGALDDGDVDALAARLGVTSRQVRRLFDEHVGAPPVAVAQARRVHFARTLLVETSLPITDVAFAAGFSSLRRFNTAMRSAYRIAPRAMRRGRADASDAISLRLPYRAPYDWQGLIEFLGRRAIPGVESVVDGEYRRTIVMDGIAGVLRVCDGDGALVVSLPRAFTRHLKTIVDRVRRMFDLFADPHAIRSHLERDKTLRPLIRRWPGTRVPGAWDPFELAVRAIVGQQVSVAGATTIAGRIAERYGTRIEGGIVFPNAQRLANARVGGMPRARAATIRAVARANGALDGVRGVGPWTLSYVAMRSGDPDAFPHGDLALRKAASCNDRELLDRAEAWRPWRAYAALLLWRSLS